MNKPELKALLLIGGKSRRMGQEKASLIVGAESLQERALAVLKSQPAQVFLSVAYDDMRAHDLPVIRDLEPAPGPLGGLVAAFDSDPDAAWLVLACDMPRVAEKELAQVVAARTEGAEAVAFLSPLDGKPEPLCALYEPIAAKKLRAFLANEHGCARRFLTTLERIDLQPEDARALLNLNRPQDLAELAALAEMGTVEKSLIVEYFAKLSQEAETSREDLRTSAATLAGLWDEVTLRHRFSLALENVKPARNDEFVSWDERLVEGDRVAFMPPFAGG